MSDLLSSMAVSRRSDTDALELMQAYLATDPQMVQAHAPSAPAATAAPRGTGAGDRIEPR